MSVPQEPITVNPVRVWHGEAADAYRDGVAAERARCIRLALDRHAYYQIPGDDGAPQPFADLIGVPSLIDGSTEVRGGPPADPQGLGAGGGGG